MIFDVVHYYDLLLIKWTACWMKSQFPYGTFKLAGMDLGFCEKGIARPAGVAGLWKDGMVNHFLGYSSFLKDGGSFIIYIRCTIKEKKDASRIYYANMEIMARNPHIVLWLKGC